MERCMVAFTKQKDYWLEDVWLLYKTEGLLMEMCLVALQNRRIIDQNMNGCFNKTEVLLMERWMVAFTRNDYWWKDVFCFYKKMNIDGKIYGCFTRQQA